MSPVASACRSPSSFIESASGANGVFTGGTLSFPFVSARCSPLSPIVSVSGASASDAGAASAGSAPSSPVASAHCFLSSPVVSVDGASADSASSASTDGALLSPIAADDSWSIVSGGNFLSPIPPTDSRTLFLPGTPSHTCCFFLPFSALSESFLLSSSILLACNPTPVMGKRLFDQVFITQRLNTST